jgi:hypothetical protein
MRFPSHAPTPFRALDGATKIGLRAEGPRVDLLVRASRAKVRERLPSYRDLASRDPQTEPALTVLIVSAFRAPVRLLLARAPRQAVLSSVLLASAPIFNKPCDFPNNDSRDASDQLLPPNDLRVPVPRVFPARCATFIAWTPHGVLGSVRITGGPSVSRHPRTLRRIDAGHALPCCLGLLAVPLPVRRGTTAFFSRHGSPLMRFGRNLSSAFDCLVNVHPCVIRRLNPGVKVWRGISAGDRSHRLNAARKQSLRCGDSTVRFRELSSRDASAHTCERLDLTGLLFRPCPMAGSNLGDH